jgi:hypothetical protein
MRTSSDVLAPLRATGLALLLAVAASGTAHARLYAVSGAGGASSTLYELDPADGSVIATIGATGVSHVTGIACHPQTGVMYAVRNDPDQLLTIDTSTGLATVVGPTAAQIPDIAFDSSGTLYAWSESGDDLVTIDLLTGAASVVGECSCSTARTGLAFDSADDLYMSAGSSIALMDAAIGTITSSVPLSASTQNMLAFDASDALYGGQRTGSGFTLVTIDPATGTVTTVGSNLLADISGIAFCNDAPLDHFMFYKRKANAAGPTFYAFGPVTLADQFGTRSFGVVKPSGLGLPADTNGEGIADPSTHLEEYRLGKADPAFAPANARIVNPCSDVQVQVC